MSESEFTIDSISVLLIEPSSMQRKIVMGYLEDIGVRNIEHIESGKEALAEMANIRPDLVISALYLPDITGTDVVEAMRADEALQDIPFMLISSETSFRVLDPIRQAGVIAILPKPFDITQLRSALFSTINYLDPGELETRTFASEELQVLVVDDSLTARKHISRVLRNMGIENLTEAKNGVEAMALIKDNFYDLIVTDYNMPEMDGQELAEAVRTGSNQASVPILMVSSEEDESRLAAAHQSGVSAICDKPFESDTVKQLIEGMIS